MHRSFKVILLSVIALVAVLLLRPNPSAAGDIILTHNRGGENAVFFVNDEPSLVINGFDLSPHTTRFPIALDAVSISVDRPAPGSHIDLVVYQDANGGSPVDASLVHRQSVQINRRGVQRFILNEAAIITEPVAWVGFYLPVGFRFHADTSGPSVLTYWAWAPGGTFPLDNLASAPVLGPGDGTEPVSIDMQGVARITAELRPLFHQEMASDAVLGNQLIAEGEQDTSLLQGYPHCGGLLFDPEDIAITSRASFTVHCGVASEFDAPTEIVHPDGHFLDLQRAGHLYKLEAQIPQDQLVHGAVNVMPVPVTHCIQIQAGDLEQAVIAEARGIPERWHALPSVRFEDVVCAEITTASYLSYFLPRGADSPPNVNLVMGWSKVSPHPLECGLPAYVEAPVTNTGQSWFSTVSGNVKFIIENIHVRSGITTGAVELSIETSQLGPGMRHILVFAPIYVTTYVNELHRLQVRADFDNQIQETNENDNVWFTEYILSNAQQSDRCFDIPWLTATPTAPYLVEGICLVDIPREVSDGKIVIRYSDACHIDEFEQGPVSEPSAWRQTMRGCDIRVRTEVDGQDVRVRWSSRQSPGQSWEDEDGRVRQCAPGSFHQRQRKIELGGESVRQLEIDHDRPTPSVPELTETVIQQTQEERQRRIDGIVAGTATAQVTATFKKQQTQTQTAVQRTQTQTAFQAELARRQTGTASVQTATASAGTATASARTATAEARGTATQQAIETAVAATQTEAAQETQTQTAQETQTQAAQETQTQEAAAPTQTQEAQETLTQAAQETQTQEAAAAPTQTQEAQETAEAIETVVAATQTQEAQETLTAAAQQTATASARTATAEARGTATQQAIETAVAATQTEAAQETLTKAAQETATASARTATAEARGTAAEGAIQTAVAATQTEVSERTPKNLMESDSGANNVRFTWDLVSGAVSYEFQYRRAGQQSWTDPSAPPGSQNDLTVNIGSIGDGNYEWQVRADMGSGIKGPWAQGSFSFPIQ